MSSDLKTNIKRRKRARALKERGRKRLVALIGTGLVLYLVFLFGKLHWMNYQEQKELNRIRKETREIDKKYNSLKTERKKLEDIDYVKAIARKKLYLLEPSEVPIKIHTDPNSQDRKKEDR